MIFTTGKTDEIEDRNTDGTDGINCESNPERLLSEFSHPWAPHSHPCQQSVPSMFLSRCSVGLVLGAQGFQMALQKGTRMVREPQLLSPGPWRRAGQSPLGCSDPEELPGACLPAGFSLSGLICHPGETWRMRQRLPGTSHLKALRSRKAGSQNPAESQGHTLSEGAD